MARLASLGMVLICLTGCSTASLEELRQVTPKGSNFQKTLAMLYLGFAEDEATAYDWWSSKYFADKGLMLAYGQDVPPENPENWDISAVNINELNSAYNMLLDTLTVGFVSRQPERAAKMQFYYDCWLEEQEEAWQIAAIEQCKNQFYRLLNERDHAIDQSAGTLSTSYVFYFPWDSVNAEEVAFDELEAIAASLRTSGERYEVVINGHADRSGTDEYNMELSHRRASQIKDFLTARNVASSSISYFAFGESDPAVPTSDGVRKRANRRVEIFIE